MGVPHDQIPARAGEAEIGVALPISAVAGRLGLSQATLRMWQQRYGLAPSRTTSGGHRRYSHEDVERLKSVQRLIECGVSTGDAVRAVLTAAQHDIPIPAHADPVAHRVCAAALDLDGPTVRWLLRDHVARTDATTTWETVIRPVLGPIGDRWEQLPHGVAVEHLLSHIAVVILGEAVAALSLLPRQVPVVLACVPDEKHDLPLTALAASLARAGVATTVLGAATPADALASAAHRRSGVVVLYSHLVESADATVFDHLPETTARIAAGPGWNSTPLPDTIPYVNDLASATGAIITAVITGATEAGPARTGS